MNRTRRLIAAAAALALTAGACGSDGGTDADGGGGIPDVEPTDCPVDAHLDADGVVQIDMWYAFQGLAATALETIADNYNASQDKVVVSVNNQGSYGEQLAKYKSTLTNPDALPAIMTGEDTNTQFLRDSESIIQAQDCIDADPEAEEIYEDVLPAVRSFYSVDDRLIAGGFSVSNPILYLNLGHVEAAGLDVADPPKSLEDFRAWAQAMKDANIPGLEAPLVMKLDGWNLEHWMASAGAPLVNNDNGRSGLATEAFPDPDTAIEIVTWMKSMVDDGLATPIKADDDFSPYLAVATQSGSMLIETSAGATTIEAAITGNLSEEVLPQLGDLDIDVSGFSFENLRAGAVERPGLTGTGTGQIAGNGWFMMKKSDEEIAAAWDFLKFANETENLVEWTEIGGYLPSHEAAAEDPELQENWANRMAGPWLQVGYDQVLGLDPEFDEPIIGPYAAVREELNRVLNAVCLQGADPATEIAAATETINAALAEYNANPGA